MRQIGRYQIIRRLGKGGMGAVYKGIVPVIEKVVAIKILDPAEIMEDILGMAKLREIFTFEARTMASFQHPFLVTAHDFAEDAQGRPFFVMEYICKNLGDMIGEEFQMEKNCRVIPAQEVLHYGGQLLKALAFLHHNSIIHRDIKPQNILVTDQNQVKICDFGMALVEGVAFCGPETMQIGSPFYTPPEQRSQPSGVDGRADLYSAAVLLYRMLTGTFPGMQSFCLSQVNPLYDESWDAFFRKALSWNRDERFASAGEMLGAFEGLRLLREETRMPLHCSRVAPGEELRLRSEPLNVCRSRAGERFRLNEQFRPITVVERCLELRDQLARDPLSRLIWRRRASSYPLTQGEARAYIDQLNRHHHLGHDHWRLPTVDELLSLLELEGSAGDFPHIRDGSRWLWSCDLHGNHEGWYVNLDMGYAGVLDINCLNFVVPVCTMPAPDTSPLDNPTPQKP
ncbi:protein kinase domain-containing protein [Desulfogranum mediterraneum]|uniref:protein kinase domain-containing protein n=1 Tax=Desulfogranum mediterraneum TaxID=160661 RepID=UPI000419625E|nr:protein kinase [Desulfogranum mediterraneum]